MTLHVLQPSDLWDNEISTDGGAFFKSSPLARAVFTTSARTVAIVVDGDPYQASIESTRLGLRVNGADWGGVTVPADGRQTVTMILPRGENKTVEVICGSQQNTGVVRGGYLVSCTFDAASTLVAPSFDRRMVVYGDSISNGFSSDVHPLRGWVARLRPHYPGSVVVEGHGYRKLQDDCVDAAARTAFAARLASMTPDELWLAIGTNDYGFAVWTAANFGTAYADLLDKIHVQLPDAVIYCQTPTLRTTETANGLGSTLENYRTQIQTAAAARAYCVFVDGKAFVPLSEIIDSNVHPTTEGHRLYYRKVKAILGL